MSSEPTERHSIAVGSGRVRADARFVAVSASRAGGTILVVRSRGPFPRTPPSQLLILVRRMRRSNRRAWGRTSVSRVSGARDLRVALRLVPNWLGRRLLRGDSSRKRGGVAPALDVRTRRSPVSGRISTTPPKSGVTSRNTSMSGRIVRPTRPNGGLADGSGSRTLPGRGPWRGLSTIALASSESDCRGVTLLRLAIRLRTGSSF